MQVLSIVVLANLDRTVGELPVVNPGVDQVAILAIAEGQPGLEVLDSFLEGGSVSSGT